MAFKKIEMTEKQLIETVFSGDPELYKAFLVFQKHNVGLTRYDHIIMAMKIDIKVVSDPNPNNKQ